MAPSMSFGTTLPKTLKGSLERVLPTVCELAGETNAPLAVMFSVVIAVACLLSNAAMARMSLKQAFEVLGLPNGALLLRAA